MIEADLTAVTADALRRVLQGFSDERMRRAWRNRSPVTQSTWTNRVLDLHTSLSLRQCAELAAALYCACGEHLADDRRFRGASLTAADWEALARQTAAYAVNPPEKALNRWAYEVRIGRIPAGESKP